jgi:phospholipid transport system substrate-binding protein
MKHIKGIVIYLFVFLHSSALYSEEAPDQIVEQTINQVLLVLKDEMLSEEEKKYSVFNIIKEHINFKDMSRRILATNWKNATDEQKIEFIHLFEETLLNTYWNRIKRYSGESLEYISVSYDNKNTATVETAILITKNDVEIPISYRMKRYENIWFAYDFTVENLSLVQSYRTKYNVVVKRDGIQGLLKKMWSDLNILNLTKN